MLHAISVVSSLKSSSTNKHNEDSKISHIQPASMSFEIPSSSEHNNNVDMLNKHEHTKKHNDGKKQGLTNQEVLRFVYRHL